MLPLMRWAPLLALTIALPARAQEETPRTVFLGSPECAALPFAAARLRELLALELEADGARLLDDPAANVRIVYEPVPCEPGATEFAIELTTEGEGPRFYRASLSQIPLATVPRALALDLAEALRGNLPEAPPVALPEPAPVVEEPPPEPPAIAPPVVAPVPPPSEPDRSPPTRLGFGVAVRNTPDTGAVLGGLRLFIDLPVGDHLPLSLRADVLFALGGASHDLLLGWIDGGLTVSIAARALDALSLRFGPRLWLGHGGAFNAEERGATRLSGEVQFGIGVVLALEIMIAPGLELLVGGEVGTHFEELEYVFSDARSGVIGAYWAADLGLAWTL